MDEGQTILDARQAILTRMQVAAQAAGRDPQQIELVAVSKRQPDYRIDAALVAGQRVFGENRVQEARSRWVSRRYDYSDLELRLIGPLQSNKAADAVELFDVIETLDRESLAKSLVRAMKELGRQPRLYVQINTGEEVQKSGIAPADATAFVGRMRSEYGFKIEGLMCIPPIEEPAGLHFSLLAKLASKAGVSALSMGMSADFETAIQLGATSVRVGSAIFGPRGT